MIQALEGLAIGCLIMLLAIVMLELLAEARMVAEVRMVESAEGIGGRKWSLSEKAGEGGLERFVMEGVTPIARIDYVPTTELDKPLFERSDYRKIQTLLITAPQLWDATNLFLVAQTRGLKPDETAEQLEKDRADSFARLQNAVAKAVGKPHWKDVAQ